MQCPSCSKTFAATLSVCPSCGKMPTQHSGNLYCPLPEKRTTAQLAEPIIDPTIEPTPPAASSQPVTEPTPPPLKRESTLIEFPKRKNEESEWRDAVRERVREVRERRNGGTSQTVVVEKVETVKKAKTETVQATSATVINLNSSVESRPTGRLIARALERVERSRQVHQYSAAATALALAPNYEPEEQIAPKIESKPKPPVSLVPPPVTELKPAPRKIEMPSVEADLNFAAVPAVTEKPAVLKLEAPLKPLETTTEVKTEIAPPAPTAKKEPRKIAMLTEADADEIIESQFRISAAIPQKKPSPRSGIAIEQEVSPRLRENDSQQVKEDYAPLYMRFIAGLLDLALCASVTSGVLALFAPNGYFAPGSFDLNAALVVIGIFAAINFIYLTAAIVLTETTIAGYFFSIRTVHAEDGSATTVFEAALNTLGYLVSLALAGIGLIPILFSTEKRAFHDWIAGTVVIREN